MTQWQNHPPITDFPRVALVTNLLSSYRVPCFQELHKTLAEQLQIFTLAEDMTHRRFIMANEQYALPITSLKGWRWHHPPADDRHLNNILPIVKFDPGVVILSGWDEPSYLFLWLWSVFRKKKILFWIESTAFEGNRVGAKEKLKRRLLKQASACIVPGQRAGDYCVQLGVAPDRIFVAPNAIDQRYFRGAANRLSRDRQALRHQLGLDNTVAILFVGRLVEYYKNLTTLLQAYAILVERNLPITLLIVGDGTDREQYQQFVQQHNLLGVRFVGLLPTDKLCEYYTAADLMVLPSRSETWGFVLNEGMEFGLPLVVSQAVGAGPDLVHDAVNGYSTTVGDVPMLADRLTELIQDKILRKRMSDSSRQIVAPFSPENWAAGVVKAMRFAISEVKQ